MHWPIDALTNWCIDHWCIDNWCIDLFYTQGLHHEQCRPDRDQYVKINKENVYSSMLYNFDLYKESQINSRGFAYDYRSIMHYGKTAFSQNRKITIEPKDRSMDDVIGNAKKVGHWAATQCPKWLIITRTLTSITHLAPFSLWPTAQRKWRRSREENVWVQ